MTAQTSEPIPKTQKAAVSDSATSGTTIKEVPVVQPEQLGPGRVLVKILYSGVCHSDLHLTEDDWVIKVQRPCIAGHEGVGEIVAINDPASKLKLGDKVGIKWIAHTCNQCDYCIEAEEMLCAHCVYSGLSTPGTFQQYVESWSSYLTPIPDGINLAEAAPILCAGVTVYKALKTSNARAGQWVAIPGAGGGLGSLAVQYAKYMGLSVIAVDTGAAKEAYVKELGADRWIDFTKEKDIVAAIKAATPDGLGPHASIVTSPKPEAYESAMEYIRPNGTVVAVGLPPAGAVIKADVLMSVLGKKKLIPSYVGNRADAVEALRIVAEGHVKSKVRVEPFNYIQKAYDEMKKGQLNGRVVVDVWK